MAAFARVLLARRFAELFTDGGTGQRQDARAGLRADNAGIMRKSHPGPTPGWINVCAPGSAQKWPKMGTPPRSPPVGTEGDPSLVGTL